MDFEIILEDLQVENLSRLILENVIFTPVSPVVSIGIVRQGCFNGF